MRDGLTRRAFLAAMPAVARAVGAMHASPLQSAATPPPMFTEVPPSASGITWVHDNARSPQRFLPESLGPGCAFLDYDNDGWMDIYLVNSGPCDFFQPPRPLKNALYRNNRDGTFSDVTDKAGVAGGSSFGMGVASGDYDNDGYPDLFVTAYGRSTLFHNNGNGTFTDVTLDAGVGVQGWTTSAVWFDYDSDGRLDLFVCRFADYELKKAILCADRDKGRLYYHYCIPHLFTPTASLLFHNNGNGTFTRVEGGTDIERALGKGLGVVATDVNNDGRLDLFVSNDTVRNFLFINQGRGGWQERGVQAGVAYGASGQVRSGMGVDAADLNADGWQDLFVANIDHELFSLYQGDKGEIFTDVAAQHGIAAATRLLSGWGLRFFDIDNDGFVDLILANGHPDDTISIRAPEVKYEEPLRLFRHDGRRLRDVSGEAGPAFKRPLSARGLATGDFNNDGRVDVLVGCNGGAPVLLRNDSGAGNHWIGVKLQGVGCNRDAVGARVTWSAGGVQRSVLKQAGGSYLSAHDPRLVLGLGAATKVDWLEVKWPLPSGKVERFANVPVDRYVTLVEGSGRIE